MYLDRLEVTGIRNLHPLIISPKPNLNFIVGANGSGKTSILESIHILSTGHSFRTREVKKVINYELNELLCFGSVINENGRNSHKLGISKKRDGATLAKIDGEKKDRISDLAKCLPTVFIDSSSIDFVEGGPSVRRSILDWGMFHVEHSYLSVWQDYRKALKQKNALLRRRTHNISELKQQLAYWNQFLIDNGERVDSGRQEYINRLGKHLNYVVNHYFRIDKTVLISYRSGWSQERWGTLGECLASNLGQEIEKQSCLYGPHRADLEIRWEGQIAKDICSRGQKKLLLYGVRLAQVRMMAEITGRSPVLLLDDLPAELDKNNIANVARFLSDIPCQTYITAIDEQPLYLPFGLGDTKEFGMFHVKHGTISKQ